MSQIMRAECGEQPWMEVCSKPLTWEKVPCDIYSKTSSKSTGKKEDGGKNSLDSDYVLPW